MSEQKSMIPVAVCVFPDGRVRWTDDVETGPRKIVNEWTSSLDEETKRKYSLNRARSGMVLIDMYPEDYAKVCAPFVTIRTGL
jgi:hypothetical protein